MSESPFKLSCSLFGHNSDVRCVTTTADGKIISGSRDRTAKVWAPNETQQNYREQKSLECHNNFVSCVCVLPPSETHPNGFIVTGSQDHCIRVFKEASQTPIYVLKSHSNTVCKVAAGSEEGTLVSSSWDGTAKLWNLAKAAVEVTLSGHEAAVWSVLQLPCGTIVTASADKKVKIWVKNGSCLKTLTGHTDCVRDVAAAGPRKILSAANDATIRLWDIDVGECLDIIYGHANFIYSIAVFPNSGGGMFVSSGEDMSVKVWTGSELVQSIPHPAQSVWAVAILPNGDIASASSDGVLRVFSADPARQAGPDAQQAYENETKATSSAANKQIGGVNVSELPGTDALYEPGKTDGQTKLIREASGNVVAYSWLAVEGRWDKIGDVMGATGTEGVSESGRPTYNGKEFDYVFSVDIEEGKPPMKLPFNRGEDPWVAAQKFIHDHNLSQQYLEQVANFIVDNSESRTVAAPSQDYADPFTGGTRYIPGSGGESTSRAGSNSDPFTGGSSYSTGAPKPSLQPAAHTGQITRASNSIYFPQREYIRFDQANVKLIAEKLRELNEQLNGDSVAGRLSPEELEDVVKLCEMGAPCSARSILILDRLLEWPQDVVFPVLDIMRLAIRSPEANSYLCTDQLIPSLARFLGSGSSPPNNMLALRVLNNMLGAEAGFGLAISNRVLILNIIKDVTPPYTKHLQVAMATLLLNMAVVIRRAETPEGLMEALLVAEHILRTGLLTDEEAMFRAFVALGTLLTDMVNQHEFTAIFKTLLQGLNNNGGAYGPRVTECKQHILNMLG